VKRELNKSGSGTVPPDWVSATCSSAYRIALIENISQYTYLRAEERMFEDV